MSLFRVNPDPRYWEYLKEIDNPGIHMVRNRIDGRLSILKVHENKKLTSREVGVLQCMHHPNIISFRCKYRYREVWRDEDEEEENDEGEEEDSDEDEEEGDVELDAGYRTGFMMEYCNGGSLDQWIRAAIEKKVKGASESMMWLVFEGLAEAANYLHTNGANLPIGYVVHHDIKPSNVFLGSVTPKCRGDKFRVVLADFDHRWTEKDCNTYSPNIYCSTYDFTPPGAAHPKTRRTHDIYQIGLVMRCLGLLNEETGIAALDPRKCSDKDRKDFYEDIQAKSIEERGYSSELVSLVRWCLQCDPQARPTSVELLAAVNRRPGLQATPVVID
jgi:serine/threonine protein kinase